MLHVQDGDIGVALSAPGDYWPEAVLDLPALNYIISTVKPLCWQSKMLQTAQLHIETLIYLCTVSVSMRLLSAAHWVHHCPGCDPGCCVVCASRVLCALLPRWCHRSSAWLDAAAPSADEWHQHGVTLCLWRPGPAAQRTQGTGRYAIGTGLHAQWAC